MKCIHPSVYYYHIEASAQQLQLDANLFFVEVRDPRHDPPSYCRASSLVAILMYEEWCVHVSRTGPGCMRRWYHWLQSIPGDGRRRSFAVSVKSPSHDLTSNRTGAFLLRGSASSPMSISPALLVTFVQNMYTCSSPRMPLSIIDATCLSQMSRSNVRLATPVLSQLMLPAPS